MSEVLGDNPLPTLRQAESVGEVALLGLPLSEGDVATFGGEFPTGGAHPDPRQALAPSSETLL